MTVTGALVEPAGIVTLAGIDATIGFELPRPTTAPPAGAGPFSVTVAVPLFPPTGLVGLKANVTSVGTNVTVSVADFETPAEEAVMTAPASAATGSDVTVKAAVFAPAGTVTLAGTVAADALPLLRLTTIPLPVAFPVSVAVPTEGTPPKTLAGLSETVDSAAGVTVMAAVVVTAPQVPEIPTVVVTTCPVVVIVNVLVFAPAATVTVAGTVAIVVSELTSETTAPPVGAFAFRVIVPETFVPPPTEAPVVTLMRAAAGVT